MAYFADQLDKPSVALPPEGMSRERVDAGRLREVEAHLWDLWHRANKPRLEAAGISTAMPIDKPVWTLPGGDRMKLATYAKGERPSEGYPMIIHLHGGGKYPETPVPWGSEVNETEWFQSLDLSGKYKDAPALVMVPRMPDDRKGRWYHAALTHAYRRAYQLGVLSGLVDPDRFYITGISEGGYGTMRIGPFMPDYFAAVGCLAASAKPGPALMGLSQLPFRMEVGENDGMYGRNVYVYLWQDRLAELSREGGEGSYPHEVIVQRGRGHFINYYGMTPWLIRHRRKAQPDRISYLYHCIDADDHPTKELTGFSSGVYCLDLRGLRPDGRGAQLSIDLRKEGNRYRLTTRELSGHVAGTIGLYLGRIDFDKPVVIEVNGKVLHEGRVYPTRGAMADAIALFGDPRRIFPAKVLLRI